MTPNQVTHENEQELLDTVYNYKHQYSEKNRRPLYNVGDYVRLSMNQNRTVFDKSYTPNWTTAIFQIRQVQYNTDPITYLLKDENNTEILGSVYAEELQRVKNPNEFLVEKIIRRRGDSVYVKWLGFDSSYNQWIPATDLID